jgi:hypothetical protein
MARFIIADITEAKSIHQELMAIVPHLPNVPIKPILERGHNEYPMFESFAPYPWVLPIHIYGGREELLNGFKINVIEPVENWLKTRNSAATRRITAGEQ